jgi:hypothetical protein
MKVLPIESLGSKLTEDARALLAEADVIIGIDLATQREFTVFGTPSLESTITMKKPSAMQVVQVPLDFNGGELEELAQLVREIKGMRVTRRAK